MMWRRTASLVASGLGRVLLQVCRVQRVAVCAVFVQAADGGLGGVEGVSGVGRAGEARGVYMGCCSISLHA